MTEIKASDRRARPPPPWALCPPPPPPGVRRGPYNPSPPLGQFSTRPLSRSTEAKKKKIPSAASAPVGHSSFFAIGLGKGGGS